MTNLLATKLHQPAPPPRRVQRPHLLQRLDDGLAAGRQVTLLSAPAGFGKTTCVSAWLSTLERWPVAWLSLDPADDDPGRFFTYFVAALQQVHPQLGRNIPGLFQSQAPPASDMVLTLLVNDILALQDPFLLVLDDLHVLQDPFILDVLEQLVDNLPPALHLVLLTREDPPLPLARLRANNQLTELRARDLRFTRPDIEGFFSQVMELSLSPADIDVVELKTEGWAVGLQLAALAVRDRDDPSRFIHNLSGSHRFIFSYLTEEVLSQQPAAIQHFMLQTSILERLNGELCDAVTGRAGSHTVLEWLYNANLFLVPLDDRQRWYRYHHLFADLLAHRRQRTLPDQEVQALHARASHWLAQNDLMDEAIRHALAGADYDRAAALVAQEARTKMFTGRVNTLKNWLAALPEVAFQTQPRLNIYRAWIQLLHERSDLSPQALQETEDMLQSLPPSPENDRLRVELLAVLCRFVALAGDTARARQLAHDALARLPATERSLRARAHSALAIAHALEGHADQAQQAHDRTLRLARAAGNDSLAVHATVMMALAQTDYGQLHQAARSYQSIIDMGDQSGQEAFLLAGQGYVGLAGIHLEWHDLDRAAAYLEQGIALCRQGGLPGVFTGHAHLARLRQARGDLEGARAALRALRQPLQGIDPVGVVRHVLLALATGDLQEADRLATPLTGRLDAGPSEPQLPLLVAEIARTLLARIRLARGGPGDIERALHLLDQVEATAGPDRRLGRLIEVHLLRALAVQAQHPGRPPAEALQAFRHALKLAAPQGYTLLFLEAGTPVIPLLKAVREDPATPYQLQQYAARLLDTFARPGHPQPPVSPQSTGQPAPDAGLIEPLTPRELEVLQRVAAGDSNRTIAAKLFITVRTVKKHTGNIYGKLGVHSRTQAIARALELGLLSGEE